MEFLADVGIFMHQGGGYQGLMQQGPYGSPKPLYADQISRFCGFFT